MIDGVHIWRAHLEGPSRPILRRVLGHYLDAEPGDDEFERDERGKPRLRAGKGIEFNLSHSQNLLLVAVAERPVGVDVEAVRPRRNLLRLAERFLEPSEAATVSEAPEAERERLFHRAWTRHEARLKCLGAAPNLQSAAAEVADPRPAVENVEVAPAYAAAVAVLGTEVGAIDCRSL
jgi:4'-phosphopantetheinyl transferase